MSCLPSGKESALKGMNLLPHGANSFHLELLLKSPFQKGIAVCGGNLGVIVVWVCEPVFRNIPHLYTWPLKKQAHSYT